MAILVRPLSEAERERLEQMRRSRTGDAGLARRAAMVLRSAQGEKAPAISKGLGVSERTVRKWIRRFTAQGLEGLRELPRPGRPPVYLEVERGRVIQAALPPPQQMGKPFCHWTLDQLEEHLQQEGCSMRRSRIHEVLRAEGVKWQKERTWFASPDPQFAEKRGRLWGSTSIPLREVE